VELVFIGYNDLKSKLHQQSPLFLLRIRSIPNHRLTSEDKEIL